MQPERFYLRFPDAATALEAARSVGFAGDDATEIAKDGWLTALDGNQYQFATDVVFGTGKVEDQPGFHVNGLWFGPPELAPDFGAARVYPENPVCVFG